MSATSLSDLRLLLLGYGHVAQALLPLLASRSTWLASEFSIRPLICGIATRRQGFYIHPSGIAADVLLHTRNPFELLHKTGSPVSNGASFISAGKSLGASVLLELTTLNPQNGEPALTHIRTALQAGVDVITANKGPVAYAQTELQALAQRHNVQFRFEATVMDGLPLINLAQYTLPAVGISSFHALLNTTSSLVLSRIEQGLTLNEAISQAQRLGVAEADPWYDLDGEDASMKTTILANNLLAGQLTPSLVQRQGIRDLSLDDIRSAASAGTPIRLVSQAYRHNDGIIAQVRPHKIPPDDILHVGTTTTGVISLVTDAMGTITLVEHEPTVTQTAYGVLSDLITVLRQRRHR